MRYGCIGPTESAFVRAPFLRALASPLATTELHVAWLSSPAQYSLLRAILLALPNLERVTFAHCAFEGFLPAAVLRQLPRLRVLEYRSFAHTGSMLNSHLRVLDEAVVNMPSLEELKVARLQAMERPPAAALKGREHDLLHAARAWFAEEAKVARPAVRAAWIAATELPARAASVLLKSVEAGGDEAHIESDGYQLLDLHWEPLRVVLAAFPVLRRLILCGHCFSVLPGWILEFAELELLVVHSCEEVADVEARGRLEIEKVLAGTM